MKALILLALALCCVQARAQTPPSTLTVATCPTATSGTLFGTAWLPCSTAVVQVPLSSINSASINTMVADLATGSAASRWLSATAVLPTDQVYTNTLLTGGSANWWPASALGLPPAGSPGAPASLTATGGTASLQLTWSAAANEMGYNVVVGSSAAAVAAADLALNGTPACTTANPVAGAAPCRYSVGNVLTTTFTNVPAGTYFASVWAWTCPTLSTCSLGASSPVQSATVGNAVLANGSAAISWTPSTQFTSNAPIPSTDQIGFLILQESVATPIPAIIPTPPSTPINATPVSGATYNVTGLTQGQSYCWAVEEVDITQNGTSAPSATVCGTVPNGLTPAAPTGATVTITVQTKAPAAATPKARPVSR